MIVRSSGFQFTAACLILFSVVFFRGTAHSFSFPFEENFENDPVSFTVMPDSGWGVIDSQAGYSSYDGSRHLENCVDPDANSGKFFCGICAETSEYISIPKEGKPPVLSFWYKSDLEENESVIFEIHSHKKDCFLFLCGEEEKIDTVRIYTGLKNTDGFHEWEKISLGRYKGRDIRVVLRQSNAGGGSPLKGLFVVDDFRITRLPPGDADRDGIPDEYDPTPNDERLPEPDGVQALHAGAPYVELSWDRMESPFLAGYRVYRRETDRKHERLLNDALISPDTPYFLDAELLDGETYGYRVVAVSREGREGSPSPEATISINYDDPLVIPFEESFDSVAPDFFTPGGGAWRVADSHGEWGSYSCNRHLDSNPGGDGLSVSRGAESVRAIMPGRVHIPEDAKKPALSFWYKSDLCGLPENYFDGWSIPDYMLNWKFMHDLFGENKVIVDIHYIGHRKTIHGKGWPHGNKYGWDNEGVDRDVRVFNAWPAVSEYTWTSIPLEKYRGMDVCIMFRQESAWNTPPGMFVIDDFRISDLPEGDADGNGVPDEYDGPMNPGMLPFVKNFDVKATEIGPVELSWTPIVGEAFPSLDGYDIYRKTRDSAADFQKINTDPIAPDAEAYTDHSVENHTTYQYYLVAVSMDEINGYATRILEAEVDVPMPVISASPVDITVQERQPVTFPIDASGPGLVYQWQKNGMDIPGANGSEYTMKSAALEDSGSTFSCVVSNFAGSVTSESAVLTVELAPPLMVESPADLTVTEREPAELTMEYIGSRVNIQWRKNGEDIPGATAPAYSMESTPLSDDGAVFTCVVSNAAGSVTSDPATLTVKLAPPLLTASPESLIVTERNPAEFTVGYIGSLLTFQWQKNGEDIPGATESTLKISETVYDTDNQARYRCVIGNAAGSVTSPEAVLTVIMIPPEITRQPADVSAGVRESAEFSVKVIGSSLSYRWQRFRADIPGADLAVHEVDETEWSDNEAVYRCIVSNPAGSVTSTEATLTVIDNAPPELSIEGDTERTTETDMVTVTGRASDIGSGLDRVFISSDRYAGREFAGVFERMGAFTCQAPLLAGENKLAVYALDRAGNRTSAELRITFELPQLPIISITSPGPGETFAGDYADVSGTVLCLLPPEEIQLALNNTLQFPQGGNGEYTFSFKNVRLVPGPNTLLVKAVTQYGETFASVTVMQDAREEEAAETPPEVAIESYQPEISISGDSFVVSGMTTGQTGIVSVTVNGAAADVTGEGQTVSFDYRLENFCGQAGSGGYPVEVQVTDSNGNTTTRSFVIRCDGAGPRITVDSLEISPAVNAVQQNPYTVSGTVTEENLAGLLINNQSVGVLPQEGDTYSFSAALPLSRGEDTHVTIDAMDFAGNMTTRTYILNFDAFLDPEILRPAEGAVVSTGSDLVEVPVTVRAFGMEAADAATVTLNGGTTVNLAVTDNVASGVLELSGDSGEHTLDVEIRDPEGALLGSASSAFSVKNTGDVPLEVVRSEPGNMASGIEPSSFIAYYFNRRIDPALLSIEVFETAHGKIYEQQDQGADFTELNDIRLIDVHRDMEPVEGGLSHFPEQTMTAFYPSREFAYGGTIYANLIYDGEVIHRSTFNIRPLPTLVEGFVTDQFKFPLEGITVKLYRQGGESVSNEEGYYEFGFGESAGRMVPPGRYLAVYNPERDNPKYGTTERWITVNEGRLNSITTTVVPFMNPEEPFSRIASGEKAYMDAGGLVLDLSGADLLFKNGRDHGDVKVLFLTMSQVSAPFAHMIASPWVYAIQPQGIELYGELGVEMALPARFDSHDYVAELPELVLLTGRDSKSLRIVPVGVGRVDKEHNTVSSVRPFAVDRLDYIGYAPLPQGVQTILEAYADGEMDMNQLRSRLFSTERE